MRRSLAIIRSTLLFAAAAFLISFPGLRIPYVDDAANRYFADTVAKTTVAYGTCRLINASVSLAKDSDIQLQPAGVGLSVAVGQLLDPVDDMTERASDILVTALVSLGVQKIAYELAVAFAPLAAGLLLLSLLPLQFAANWRAFVRQALAIVVAARLCLPISALLNVYLNEHYFHSEIDRVRADLVGSTPQADGLADLADVDKKSGTWDRLKSGLHKVVDAGSLLRRLVGNATSIVSNLVRLAYLYVAVFVVQVVALPLGTFWLMTRVVGMVGGPSMSPIVRHEDLVKELRALKESVVRARV